MRVVRVLGLLLALVVGWVLFAAVFIAVADPYGVSPIGLSIPHFNAVKLKRIDIDRNLKPYEVWLHQPKTVFLGTSRIHQAIAASHLDETPLAPAYNASIPAGSLATNIANLDEYIRIDPSIKTVFVELFLWNFVGQGQEYTLRTRSDLVLDAIKLHLSARAFADAISTLVYNVRDGRPAAHIAKDGHYVYAPGHNPEGLFAGFPNGIREMYPSGPPDLKLYRPAFDAFKTINEMAKAHGIRIVWLVTPEHAYVDELFDLVGAWGLVSDWLSELSRDAEVYSFSQPNPWVYEEVKQGMRYWNDPFHLSSVTGDGMLAALQAKSVDGLPSNFMLKLTPENVPDHIESRRAAIKQWAAGHAQFVQALSAAIGGSSASTSSALH